MHQRAIYKKERSRALFARPAQDESYLTNQKTRKVSVENEDISKSGLEPRQPIGAFSTEAKRKKDVRASLVQMRILSRPTRRRERWARRMRKSSRPDWPGPDFPPHLIDAKERKTEGDNERDCNAPSRDSSSMTSLSSSSMSCHYLWHRRRLQEAQNKFVYTTEQSREIGQR